MFATLTRTTAVSLLISSILWFSSAAPAEDPPLPAAATCEQIAQWIQQLDASLFAERNEASRQLEAAGRAAFPALAEAAAGQSRETRMRALEIVRKHFEEGEEGTKRAAREALEKIAAGPHEAAAARAKEVLDPPDPAPMAVGPAIAPPQVQIQVNAIAGGQVQRLRVANGVKQIEVQDGKRKIKITESPAQGISVEVTQTKDGQEATEKHQAKNAEELKKNHPEAHQIYEKFAKQVGGLQGGGLQIQAGALPAGWNPAGAARQSAARLLGSSRQLLETSLRQLEQARGDGEQAQQVEETIKRLKGIAQQLEEEQRKLSHQ